MPDSDSVLNLFCSILEELVKNRPKWMLSSAVAGGAQAWPRCWAPPAWRRNRTAGRRPDCDFLISNMMI